ncbi:hypothetical protein FOA52_003143 [Chlamydomonas sp. UWO 241]|nr:hypothetical protein FOA52_003143 [Chlamydomonas sp. UWO 241]
MVSKIKYQKQFGGKHVLITGGSEGIGLALAQSFVRAHAHVTVVARSQAKLDAAKSSLEGLATEVASTSRINIESADVTNPQQVSDAVRSAQQAIGPIDVLVCNAGMALPGYFHEQSLDVFRQHMDVNYFGCVNTVKAVYDGMVARNAGRICLMSSTLGLMGIVGYTGYCGSKYAVRGFADALRNELVGTEVSVSIMFPPDTKTPGFEHENTMKPPETAEISAGADLVSPEKVGWRF